MSSTTEATTTLKRRKSSIGCLWKFDEQFLLNIICPDYSTLTLIHNIKESCGNVLSSVCARLGILETEMFGLALYSHNEFQFLPENKCLNGIFPKWAIATEESLSGTDKCNIVADTLIKTCKMYLRVRMIVSSFDILSSAAVRFLFEQLRWDLIKMHNLLGFEGYEDETTKLAFYCLLVDPLDGKALINAKSLSHYLPQNAIKANSVDWIISNVLTYSKELPLMTSLEAQVAFIKLALKLPTVGTHIFQADLTDVGDDPVTNCIISVGLNSIRIFADWRDTWKQYVKWDFQEIDEITTCKNMVTIFGYENEADETTLQFYNKSKAKDFTKFCKEIQKFDEATFMGALLLTTSLSQKSESNGNLVANSDRSSKRKLSMFDKSSMRLQFPMQSRRLSERKLSDQFIGIKRENKRIQEV